MLFLLKRYKRERIIAQGINKREVRFVPLKKVGIACVVYYVTSQQSAQQLPQVVELLEESGIKFKILLLEKKRGLLKKLGLLPLREESRYVVVEKREYNWLGIPKGKAFAELMQEEISPYIIPNMQGLFLFDYIACKANTLFIIGMKEQRDLYKMIIRSADGTPLSQLDFVAQALHNMSIINSDEDNEK
ncbi:MAG: hypothetical protein PUI09_07495 [bacterium]|nr:hypothetical protein [bacterium]MDY2650656.1 hypothetical protein [Candidatus Egerieousia sp.]